MSTPSAGTAPTAVVNYRIPSLGWRILGGALRLIPLVVVLIGVPVAVFTFLESHGVSPPIPILTVELAGIALTILIVARYIFKPTIAFGPLSIASAVVTLLYLWVVLVNATYTLAIPGAPVAIGVDYRNLILLLLLVPAFALAAGVVTTVEDVAAPRERLPFDFPP